MNRKELLFAIGALRALGCSEAYAAVIAERILQPNAVLNWDDAEWLRLVRGAQRLALSAVDPRWKHAN